MHVSMLISLKVLPIILYSDDVSIWHSVQLFFCMCHCVSVKVHVDVLCMLLQCSTQSQKTTLYAEMQFEVCTCLQTLHATSKVLIFSLHAYLL